MEKPAVKAIKVKMLVVAVGEEQGFEAGKFPSLEKIQIEGFTIKKLKNLREER